MVASGPLDGNTPSLRWSGLPAARSPGFPGQRDSRLFALRELAPCGRQRRVRTLQLGCDRLTALGSDGAATRLLRSRRLFQCLARADLRGFSVEELQMRVATQVAHAEVFGGAYAELLQRIERLFAFGETAVRFQLVQPIEKRASLGARLLAGIAAQREQCEQR